MLVSFAYLNRLLKSVHENFGIKAELGATAKYSGVILIFYIAWVFVQRFHAPFPVQILWNSVFFGIYVPVGLTYLGIYRVLGIRMRMHLWPSSSSKRSKMSGALSYKRNMMEVLNEILDTDTRDFKNFLIREFSVENLLFIEAVMNFKKENTNESCPQAAITLYNEFCSPNALLQVNISSIVHSGIQSKLSKPDLTIFDRAVDEIKIMLCHDTMMRYTKFQSKRVSHIVSTVTTSVGV
jgi:hypothetical protein